MEKKTLHESEYLEKLTEYIRENKSNSEIAEIFGVSKTTVTYWVRKNGLTGQRQANKIDKAVKQRKTVEKLLEQLERENRKVEKGHNEDRHLCKTCVWRTGKADRMRGMKCNFVACAECSRGKGQVSAADCDKYIKGKRIKARGE